MKLKLTYLLLFILISVCSYAQQDSITKSFEITADAHGFKCPFLTPKYIQRIQNLDSCKVWRTPDLVIHVEFHKQTEVTEEQLLYAAEKTGYERKNITVREIAIH